VDPEPVALEDALEAMEGKMILVLRDEDPGEEPRSGAAFIDIATKLIPRLLGSS
jgi:hypothetical protein